MKKSIFKVLFYISILLCGLFLWSHSAITNPTSFIYSIQLNDDSINPVTAKYITDNIQKAEDDQAQALMIHLDTPGGLLSSTRTIVKRMLKSKVPIIVYVSPGGARAGSAGVFITYASHIAAMAPATNIGAAHPVNFGGGGSSPDKDGNWNELKGLISELQKGKEDKITELVESENTEDELIEVVTFSEETEDIDPENLEHDDNPMASKILQDTVAFIRSIAKERGRNEEWAIKSVVKSHSITADEAFEKKVVDIIADSDEDLLQQLQGREVMVAGKKIVLETKNTQVVRVEMDMRQKFFNILADPNIAYFLMILGFYGLLFEITHPGIGIPGIVGGVFLILAFYSMQTLPTNYAGVALALLGLILFIAEGFVPGFGLLSLGGLVCSILGGMLLFDSIDPVMQVSMYVLIFVSCVFAAFSLFIIRALLTTMKAKVVTGRAGLIGLIAEVRSDIKLGEEGKVFVHGELWNAVALQDVKKLDKVKVVKIDGLLLTVDKI